MSEVMEKAPIAHPDRFFIGGAWVDPSSSATLDVIDSDSEEVFVTVAEAQAADIERAVAAARNAFDSGPWPRLSHAERAEWLRKIAREMDARAVDTARIWSVESGMVHSFAAGSATMIGGAYDYYAGLADSFDQITDINTFDAKDLKIGPNGELEIIFSAKRPAGYTGNWAPITPRTSPLGPVSTTRCPTSTWLSQPPMPAKKRKPSSSMWVICRPISSM